MDFAAWIEVYLGGRWYTFDPRNNAPQIGRVLIAHGRDAADVPLTHIFGPPTLSGFRVWAAHSCVQSGQRICWKNYCGGFRLPMPASGPVNPAALAGAPSTLE